MTKWGRDDGDVWLAGWAVSSLIIALRTIFVTLAVAHLAYEQLTGLFARRLGDTPGLCQGHLVL